MRNLFVILVLIILSAGCGETDVTTITDLDADLESMTLEEVQEFPRVDEEFVDSTGIGKGGDYKIIIRQIRDTNRVVAEMELYKRKGDGWFLQQVINKEKNGITGLSVKVSDFNNDGYNDVTYKSEVAARGANELRNLFIFDKEHDSLVFVKNSSHFPNLEYNSELDCIDAWLVYAGSSTVFLHLESDTLREFAGVSLLDTRTIYTIDENGKRKILSKELIEDSVVYMRYSNYNPLKINYNYFPKDR